MNWIPETSFDGFEGIVSLSNVEIPYDPFVIPETSFDGFEDIVSLSNVEIPLGSV